MPKNRIQIVSFDYNGTLADDAGIAHQACNHMFRWYGKPPITFELFRETFGTPWMDFFKEHGVEEIDIPLHQKEYQKIIHELQKDGLYLHKGVLETLDKLKDYGLQIAVLSSRNIEDLNKDLEYLRINKYFSAIIGEDHINEDGIRSKKKADKLIERFDIKNSSTVLHIGDMVQDIRLAKEQGFMSGAFTKGWQSRKRLVSEEPDEIFDSYKDILGSMEPYL